MLNKIRVALRWRRELTIIKTNSTYIYCCVLQFLIWFLSNAMFLYFTACYALYRMHFISFRNVNGVVSCFLSDWDLIRMVKPPQNSFGCLNESVHGVVYQTKGCIEKECSVSGESYMREESSWYTFIRGFLSVKYNHRLNYQILCKYKLLRTSSLVIWPTYIMF